MSALNCGLAGPGIGRRFPFESSFDVLYGCESPERSASAALVTSRSPAAGTPGSGAGPDVLVYAMAGRATPSVRSIGR